MAREKLKIIHVILADLLVSACLSAGEWTPVEVTATAYCPCVECCGTRAAGITANNTDVHTAPYGIAVDPRWVPYGTVIFVPVGIGYLDRQQPDQRTFVADDTGGIIRRRTQQTGRPHVDLRFVRHSSAVKFGVRHITVYVWRP